MRVIRYFDQEFTKEEWIQREVCKTSSVRSLVSKLELEQLCVKREIKFTQKNTKKDLFSMIIDSGFSYDQMAEQFHIGVDNRVYQSSFDLTSDQVKRLEKKGYLKVVGKEEYIAYGKYRYSSLYDIDQFLNLTDETMKEWIRKKKSL